MHKLSKESKYVSIMMFTAVNPSQIANLAMITLTPLPIQRRQMPVNPGTRLQPCIITATLGAWFTMLT